ncbi:hypothetical protein OG800_49850 (plasmid) [Streptomyces sp. NBC_00445]|uniref:hypothetical protein n=1 Tax=Streptomyces sp. NBC_00445 TaxID=2975745 RepID=UPI002E240C4B
MMRRVGWGEAIVALRAQGQAARNAAKRVDELRGETARDRLGTAVAVSYVVETDYLRSAAALLRAHLGGGRPPRRLPVARVWPRGLRDVWKQWMVDRRGGVWRAIPGSRLLERVRAARPDASLRDVAEQLQALQASGRAHREHPRMYEKFIPDGRGPAVDSVVGASGRSAPTMPGFPDRGHWINRNFASGSGIRIQPDRIQEARQLERDESAVHERVLAFGDAVLRLLTDHHRADSVGGDAAGSARTHGAALWIAQEQRLVPDRPVWPDRPNAFQSVTLAGLSLLVMALAAIPLTAALQANAFDHLTLLMMVALVIGMGGVAVIYRYGAQLVRKPEWRAAVPGFVAAAAAIMVWQAQAPLAGYYFAGPYERFDRQFLDGCLAASPYRSDAVRSHVDDRVLVVTPINGETPLRLGPAEDGSTHPLRPLNDATRTVLDRYGC